MDTIDRDYKCVIYLGTVIKIRRGKESLALSKKWPKMHFEEKILEKKHCYILVTKIITWSCRYERAHWFPQNSTQNRGIFIELLANLSAANLLSIHRANTYQGRSL